MVTETAGRTVAAGRTVHSAAFFDLDNTLVQGASLFHLARGLTAHGMVSRLEIAGHALRQVRFRVFGEQSGLLDDVQEHALDFVKGHEVARMEKICEAVFEDYLADKIWPGTRALSEAHLLNGKEVWLVTAAPMELAQVIARQLALTGALATQPESLDGVYTGRISGPLLHGPDKARQVAVTVVAAPTARIGAITEAERAIVRQRSPVGGKYDTAVNRESAAEMLAARAGEKVAATAPAGQAAPAGNQGPGWGDAVRDVLLGNGRRQGVIEAMAKSATRSIGSRLGTQIVRGAGTANQPR